MLTPIIWSICLCGSTGPSAQPKCLGLLMSLPGNRLDTPQSQADCTACESTHWWQEWLCSPFGDKKPDCQPARINSILLWVQTKKKKSNYTHPRLGLSLNQDIRECKRSRVTESLVPPSMTGLVNRCHFLFQVIKDPQNSFFHYPPLIL